MNSRPTSSTPSLSPAPSSLQLPPCNFSSRIVSIDSYTSQPIKDLDVCYSDFRSSPVEKVPVIRIFGATPLGQKTCLHVHGAFPYLYVPCMSSEPDRAYLQLVARSIDHALQVSLGPASRSAHHVYKIVLAKGIPYYGYHEKKRLFLKIYLYNPGFIKRLAELLVAGVVMNEKLQPHESHVPFVLQFMIDHHLFGMNHIHLANVKFRITGSTPVATPQPPPPPFGNTPLSPQSPISLSSSLLYHPSQMHWSMDTLPRDMIVCVPRASVCELEADAIAADILNRHELSLVSEGYPGLAALWEEERLRRCRLGIDAPLSPPPSPGRSSGAEGYHGTEERLQEELDRIVQERLQQSHGTFDDSASEPASGSVASGGSRQGGAAAPSVVAEGTVVINSEALEQSRSLSQRCSEEAIEHCSDQELLELMMELCQTPSCSQTNSQQLPSSQQQLPTSLQQSQQMLYTSLQQPPVSQQTLPTSLQQPPTSQQQLPPSNHQVSTSQQQLTSSQQQVISFQQQLLPSQQQLSASQQPLLSTSQGSPQQSIPSSPQTIGQTLIESMRRSRSAVSACSLFSSPSPKGNPNRLSARWDPLSAQQPSDTSDQVDTHDPTDTGDQINSGPVGTNEQIGTAEPSLDNPCSRAPPAFARHLTPVYANHQLSEADLLEDSCISLTPNELSNNDSSDVGVEEEEEEEEGGEGVASKDLAKPDASTQVEREALQGSQPILSQLDMTSLTPMAGDISKALRNLEEVDPDLELAMVSPLMNPQLQEMVTPSQEMGGMMAPSQDLMNPSQEVMTPSGPPGVGGSSAHPDTQPSQEIARNVTLEEANHFFDDSLGDEITGSQFTLPCAQPSPQTVAVDDRAAGSHISLWDVEHEWDMLLSYETPKVKSQELDRDDIIQLEYDISEADMAQFNHSGESFASILSGMSGMSLDMKASESGGEARRQESTGKGGVAQDSQEPSASGEREQPSLPEVTACHQDRRKLLRLVLGEESGEESVDSCEEEELVWDDEEEEGGVCFSPITVLRGGQRQTRQGRAVRDRGIPQLDGTAPSIGPIARPTKSSAGSSSVTTSGNTSAATPGNSSVVTSVTSSVETSVASSAVTSIASSVVTSVASSVATLTTDTPRVMKRKRKGRALGVTRRKKRKTDSVEVKSKSCTPTFDGGDVVVFTAQDISEPVAKEATLDASKLAAQKLRGVGTTPTHQNVSEPVLRDEETTPTDVPQPKKHQLSLRKKPSSLEKWRPAVKTRADRFPPEVILSLQRKVCRVDVVRLDPATLKKYTPGLSTTLNQCCPLLPASCSPWLPGTLRESSPRFPGTLSECSPQLPTTLSQSTPLLYPAVPSTYTKKLQRKKGKSRKPPIGASPPNVPPTRKRGRPCKPPSTDPLQLSQRKRWRLPKSPLNSSQPSSVPDPQPSKKRGRHRKTPLTGQAELSNSQAGTPPSPSNGQAGTPQPSNSQAGTPQPSNSQAGTPQPSNSKAGTPQPSNSQAGTPQPSNSQAGTPQPSNSQAGTPKPSNSQAGTPKPSNSQAGTTKPSNSQAGTPKPSSSQAGTSKPSNSQAGTPKPSSSQARTPQPSHGLVVVSSQPMRKKGRPCKHSVVSSQPILARQSLAANPETSKLQKGQRKRKRRSLTSINSSEVLAVMRRRTRRQRSCSPLHLSYRTLMMSNQNDEMRLKMALHISAAEAAVWGVALPAKLASSFAPALNNTASVDQGETLSLEQGKTVSMEECTSKTNRDLPPGKTTSRLDGFHDTNAVEAASDRFPNALTLAMDTVGYSDDDSTPQLSPVTQPALPPSRRGVACDRPHPCSVRVDLNASITSIDETPPPTPPLRTATPPLLDSTPSHDVTPPIQTKTHPLIVSIPLSVLDSVTPSLDAVLPVQPETPPLIVSLPLFPTLPSNSPSKRSHVPPSTLAGLPERHRGDEGERGDCDDVLPPTDVRCVVSPSALTGSPKGHRGDKGHHAGDVTPTWSPKGYHGGVVSPSRMTGVPEWHCGDALWLTDGSLEGYHGVVSPSALTSHIAHHDGGIVSPTRLATHMEFITSNRHGDAPRQCCGNTASHKESPRPATSHTESPRPATSHTESPRPATSHTESPRPATSHTETPRPATSHTETPRPATSHTESPRKHDGATNLMVRVGSVMDSPLRERDCVPADGWATVEEDMAVEEDVAVELENSLRLHWSSESEAESEVDEREDERETSPLDKSLTKTGRVTITFQQYQSATPTLDPTPKSATPTVEPMLKSATPNLDPTPKSATPTPEHISATPFESCVKAKRDSTFPQDRKGAILVPLIPPLAPKQAVESASKYGILSVTHVKPFYSNPADVQIARTVGGRVLKVSSRMPYEFDEFEAPYMKADSAHPSQLGLHHMRAALCAHRGVSPPPHGPSLPPFCHTHHGPPFHPRNMLLLRDTSKQDPFEAYRQAVAARSALLSKEGVVMTPVTPAPCPMRLAATLSSDSKEQCVTARGTGDPSHLTMEGGTGTSPSLMVGVANPGDMSNILPTPPSREVTPELSGASTKATPTCSPVGVAHSTPKVKEKKEDGRCDTLNEVKGDCHTSMVPNISLEKRETSQLEGATPSNSFGFKVSQSALLGSHDLHEVQYLTCLSVELHVRTRGSLKPDPDVDPILAIFYFIHHDWPRSDGGAGQNFRLGILAVDGQDSPFRVFNRGDTTKESATPTKGPVVMPTITPTKGTTVASTGAHDTTLTSTPIKGQDATPTSGEPATGHAGLASKDSSSDHGGYLGGCGLSSDVQVEYVSCEHDLLKRLVQLVREEDPDFLIGYEVVMSSWGYLIDRAAVLDINLANEISRMPKPDPKPQQRPPALPSPFRKPHDLQVPGRIVLNVWRLMRKEVTLNVYSFENLCFHVLHKRLPHFSHQTLTSWFSNKERVVRCRVLEYYLERVNSNFSLLDKLNVIGRTSEFARLYGIEFESVSNRGSQYKVESMMLRLAKPANFIAISPSVQQRTQMAAPECIPLVLEPESKFYENPVLVLDFQSLYPSMVIAYNYCYSTCLGRFRSLADGQDFKFGTNSLRISNHVLKKVKDDVHVSPNGVAFVKRRVRRGILPIMLEEILNTRIMVKNSMKKHKGDKLLERLLNSRQLALKLVANTTFGYTAASYSGRMPCIEIADSIVQKGRETLERVIRLVNTTPEWGARVVYGDTDSVFVEVKGASKEEAFRTGNEIVERVTADNPSPVKLKFEKVYHPCILQAKKRYVGYSYESLEQKEPIFDDKGIETVRRDGCPAVGKVLERSLRLLFQSRDVSLVKTYVQRQFRKLMDGKVNIQDFTFAKEYRGREHYRPGASVPALELAKAGLAVDRRSEPRQKERVPYVIVCGVPGQPLIQLVRRPEDVLQQPGLRLNANYYITKQLIPPLDRAFSLLGVDVREWYSVMPKVVRASARMVDSSSHHRARGTLGQYFATQHCPVCEGLTLEGICRNCRMDPRRVVLTLTQRARQDEGTCAEISDICYNCVGSRNPDHAQQCTSIDCPVLHRRFRAQEDTAYSHSLLTLINKCL